MTTSPPPREILFLCTGNSCRSQMAEGWVRRLHGSRMNVASAGVDPGELDPRAVRAMAEVGVDISGQRSEHLRLYLDHGYDLVMTVCDTARVNCPVFPGASRTHHRSFPDPPALAARAATEEQAMVHYRRVRDEIRAFVEGLPDLLEAPSETES